jgi:hypothetical protein
MGTIKEAMDIKISVISGSPPLLVAMTLMTNLKISRKINGKVMKGRKVKIPSTIFCALLNSIRILF